MEKKMENEMETGGIYGFKVWKAAARLIVQLLCLNAKVSFFGTLTDQDCREG